MFLNSNSTSHMTQSLDAARLKNRMVQYNQLHANSAALVQSICQFAKEKNAFELNKLIKVGINIDVFHNKDNAVRLLAKQGDVKSVEFLINEFKANPCDAAFGYAVQDNIEQVNKQITQNSEKNQEWIRKSAVLGYIHSQHMAKGKLLRLVSLTDDKILRNLIVEKAKEKSKNLNEKSLLKKSEKLNELMRKNNLMFEQAEGYLLAAANIWLYQGQQLVREGRIPKIIYFFILSFITGKSDSRDNINIFNVANQRLRDRVINISSTGFFSLFKSKESLLKLKQEADERYENRIYRA